MNKFTLTTMASMLVIFSASSLAGSVQPARGNDGTAVVHFTGKVTAPTCEFTSQDQTIPLDPVQSSELDKVSIGSAISGGEKNFSLNLACEARAEADHIAITVSGTADSQQPEVLANASGSESGTGLELFSDRASDKPLALNTELPQAYYLDRLNAGNDNIGFVVKYARDRQNVTGGDVSADATFVVSYK